MYKYKIHNKYHDYVGRCRSYQIKKLPTTTFQRINMYPSSSEKEIRQRILTASLFVNTNDLYY